jgi:hypothetical protein
VPMIVAEERSGEVARGRARLCDRRTLKHVSKKES